MHACSGVDAYILTIHALIMLYHEPVTGSSGGLVHGGCPLEGASCLCTKKKCSDKNLHLMYLWLSSAALKCSSSLSTLLKDSIACCIVVMQCRMSTGPDRTYVSAACCIPVVTCDKPMLLALGHVLHYHHHLLCINCICCVEWQRCNHNTDSREFIW